MKFLLTLGLLSGALAAPAPGSGKHGAQSFDMPLQWTPFGFTTDTITIGNPPQKVDSFVDWTWIGQYVFTPRCHGSLSRTYECLQPSQTLFNQTESHTFVNQSRLFPNRVWNPNHFFFYDDLSVGFGSDIQRVGQQDARVTLQMADMHFKLDFAYPFSGVYGLSPVFRRDNASTQSPFYQMWRRGAYRSPITSFQYCYNSTFGNPAPARERCNGHDGLQTLGGLSPALTKRGRDAASSILWYKNIFFPIVNDINFEYDPPIYNYWAVRLTKHLIGDEEQALNTTYGGNPGAIFDHASYGHGVPMSVNSYQRLIQITNGQPLTLEEDQLPNNGNQSFVSVDCNKVSSFPPLKYQFQGHDRLWEVIPENYVEKISLPNVTEPTCVLNVRTLGEGNFVIGNFGDTFAKDKIVLFDFEKMKVGLADMPN
ncbi:acid protease [Aspergillus steynii IBT 23096]|uniref:Acid protease n=1 Tax=Aspergillus steynii IBT 23096 TaxID=1392250 RepID=A0A2I2GAF6_9EURO|nr:acid protease [Aspergillus steynii IBT 23096]PLB49861.1 acid protease [Aspergillus steynii IBT 23096]